MLRSPDNCQVMTTTHYKGNNTDIYDLRDYLECVKWFKYQKYVELELIKDEYNLERLAGKLYSLAYLMEIFHYP